MVKVLNSTNVSYCLKLNVRWPDDGQNDKLVATNEIKKKHCCVRLNIYIYILLLEFNPLNTELNPICHLLALLGAHLIFHVSRIRVKCNIFLEFYMFCGWTKLLAPVLSQYICMLPLLKVKVKVKYPYNRS
jgi:hypothetical protein